MIVFLILIFITIVYIIITVRYFNFFNKIKNILFFISFFIILSCLLLWYFDSQFNLLLIILQLGIFIAFRIHSNIFFLESPTLFLSNIIYYSKFPTEKNIKREFLKHKFIDYYISILLKQKIIKKKKNYYILQWKGIFFYRFYEFFFKLLIR